MAKKMESFELAEVPQEITREQRRSRRKREVRARTISVKRMTKRELEIGRALYPEDDYLSLVAAPSVRADQGHVLTFPVSTTCTLMFHREPARLSSTSPTWKSGIWASPAHLILLIEGARLWRMSVPS